VAKGLKYWFEFGTTETPKKLEIYEEGFSGSSVQLTGGSSPLVKSYNKDVGEKYLGGVVSMVVNIEAISTSEFQAINFVSENYGDLLVRYLIDGVAQFNAIITPFEGSDADLSAGIYNVSLGAECGLNQLKNLTYEHSNTRKPIIQVVKECLSRLNYFDEFDIKVLDNTKGLIQGDFVGVDYWDTYINDGNFEGLSCLEVINQIKQVYNEIVFSDGAWWIRNIDEISRGDSNVLTYDWAELTKTSETYNRPTVSVQRRAGGTFGRLFSQQNIKITKPKSTLANVFPQGDMTNDTGWTYSGSAGLFLVIQDGLLKNNGATMYTPSIVGYDNSYIQSPFIGFYPFQEWFDVKEKERLKIVGKATKGDYIKNLRLQVLAQAEGQTYYLTTEGTWYTFVSGYPTPIIEKTYNEKDEFVIDVPQPPYVTSSVLSSADKLHFGQYGYIGESQFIPSTNIRYDLYIRVFYPERLYEEPVMSTDPIYGQELNVDIDYIHVQKVDISGVVENGFSRNYGVPETKDRKIDFTVSIGVGYPSFPSGLDCLFDGATGDDQIVSYKRNGAITGLPIDEHLASAYLDTLANQLSFYQGSIEGGLEFTDLIEVDSVKYRIHNLSHDAKFDVSTVKLVELNSIASSLSITDIVLSDETVRSIEEQITKTLGSSTPLRYVDKNFKEFVLPNGERALGLRDDFKIKTVFSDEVFLRAASDGVITDVAEDTSSDFTLIKPAENGTYATREWMGDNAWMLNGNTLLLEGKLGSINNETVRLVANDQYKISLIASGGIMVHHATTFEDDIDAEGNITIQKGNPRLRLRDSGGSVHTNGFDVHVDGDSFLIDDNTHSRNILKNYLSSTTHITEFDADEYYFKDGATTYASLIGGNLNLPSLTASQLVATDASKNLVSLSTSTYPSLTELSYLKGVTSAIQTQLNSKFATPSGLTTNYVTKWNGTALANSQIFDNGINVGIGTVTPNFKLDIRATGAVYQNISSSNSGNIGQTFQDGLGAVYYLTSVNALRFDTNSAERLRITSIGNVGIGTTTPTLGRVQLNQSTDSSSGGFTVVNSAVTGSARMWVDSGNIARIDAGSAGTNSLVINSGSGNVGFGVVNPTVKVDINGGILNNQLVAGTINYQANHYFANSKYIDFQWYSSPLGSISNIAGVGLKFDLATYLNFATGNIGIGTVPSYKLDVSGTGHFTGAVTFDTVPSSLQDATSANHLVRYSQWIASTSVKYLPTAVNTVALTNVSSLSGVQNINGVTGVAGTTRILLTAQTDATKNSIWVMQSGAWTRATDSDTDPEIRGFIVSVSGGAYAGYKYINTNSSAITINTTNITYSEFSNIAEIDPVFVSWRDTSRTANTFWAAPNGSNGAATWRALVVADIPTLNQNTTGSAATLTTTRNIAMTGDVAWNINFNGSADVTAVGTLATVNANVGTFNNVTVNAKGLVTAASNVFYLTTNQTITLSGDVTGSGTTAITATLANSGVTAGTYTKITVDAKGRATSGTTLSASDIPSLDWSKITTGKPTTRDGYGITDVYTITESDGRFVHLQGDEDIDGIKTFLTDIKASNNQIHITEDFLNRGGSPASYGVLSNKLGAGGLILDVLANGGAYFRTGTTRKALFDTNGLILSGTLANADVPTERLHVVGNIRYSGTLKPSNTSPTVGQFLKANTTTTNVWATLTTSDISDLSSYTGFNDVYQAKDATLTALAGLDTSGGIVTQIGTDTFAKRTISGTTNRISITNGNGVSGNPTIDISSSYVGQVSITTLGTITTGVWNGGVIPILYGGTGSSTQNFVDLTTTQSSIGGAKTFTAGLTALSFTSSSGLITAGNFSTYGLTYNSLASSMIQSGQQLYFAFKPLIQRASNFVFDRGFVKIGGNTSGLPADIAFATERLDIDGNIRLSGVIKPDNVAPTAGYFLKGVDADNMAWSQLTVDDISDIDSLYQPILPSGSIGQFLVKDSTGTNNFMNLELKPMYLSHRHIPVGSYFDNYSEVRNLTFEANRVLRVSNILNQTNSVNLGITGNDTDGILEYMGIGDFWLKSQRDIYIDNFKGGGDRFLKVTTTGKVYASTSGGSGGGTATLTTNYVGFGDSGNTLTGSANFQWSDGRFLRIQDKTNTARFMGFGYNAGATEAVFTSEATSGSPLGLAIYSPSIKFSALASGTTQMVVANSVGVLSLQSIPSGGGGVGTIDQVLGAGNTAYKKTFNFENESESYINFKRHTGEVVGGIAYQSAVDKYLSIVSDNGHDILLDSDRNLLMLGTDINIGYSNTTGLINIQGMPFNFNENAQNSGSGQNGSQWGSGFNQASPVAGDRMLFFFDGTRWVVSHVRTYAGAGGKTYLTID